MEMGQVPVGSGRSKLVIRKLDCEGYSPQSHQQIELNSPFSSIKFVVLPTSF